MPSFCAVNYSNCANWEKDKYNYRFPSIFKNNSKNGLKLSKQRREKWLAQRLGFSTQSSQYQIWKANTYSVITHGTNRTWTTKFYDPTDSEHKFHKTRIENWLSIGFELESPWLETYI